VLGNEINKKFKFKSYCCAGIDKLAEQYGVGAPTMQLIIDALSRPISYDFRSGWLYTLIFT
jgi:hypothetical protein